jgi:hypothetical protein
MQGVGFARSTNEAGNDGGGKGRTCNVLRTKHQPHRRWRPDGISGNYEGLLKFYRYIKITLYKALTRRSQRAYLTWKRYRSLLEKHPMAEPRIYVNIWQAV